MKRWFVLLGLLLLLPTTAHAEAFAEPDFLVGIKTAVYQPLYSGQEVEPVYDYMAFEAAPGLVTEYFVRGERRETRLPMLIEGGRTMLPLRLVGEACGAQVAWEPQEQRAVLQLAERTAVVRLGSNSLLVNGREYELDAPPLLREDTIYLPLRAVGEALGKRVDYQSRLGQCFVYVCGQTQDYSSRLAFNQLLSQTYLKANYTDRGFRLVDVGLYSLMAIDANGNYCRLTVPMREAVGWHLYDSVTFSRQSAAENMAAFEELMAKLGGEMWVNVPPSPNAETCVIMYNDGDVRIVYDILPAHSVTDSCFEGDYFYYKVDLREDARYFRVNLNAPRDQYLVQEEISREELPAYYVDMD